MNSLKIIHNIQISFVRPFAKQIPRNLKGKSKSSQEWLTRQLSDPYVEKARMLNYRCRSAFKLLEMNEKYKIIKPGDVVIDCGAAPGSWTQIAVAKSNSTGSQQQQPKGAVYSMDLLHFHGIPGATIFGGMDFTKPISQQRLKETLAGRAVNCVLSDMAPNATGIRMLDQENIINLCYSVLRFALIMSAKGANLVVKVWDNGDVAKLEKDISRFYDKVKRVKPQSSRSDSAEHFLVARNFKGLDEINEKREKELQP
ncbi:rRNA methyltransferase 2, mitochondrial-like [Teleopsis dalmanni]|uniref:rRNA methyltransferase 2, mitochondrial-like n=1 Tax=Teleopsis dalmanni TaxID=139649 RepID=UPI0018CE6879|nr:rRNA methyltransferase 2, mitochondrial-like [Teleopsis dalmanni]XP_037952864.1 rRNA methyltransferase 2, mitochondrial-like [Teleopsis dalmanni]